MSRDAGSVTVERMLGNFYRGVDPIRKLLDSLNWSPPQVVIFGDENAGECGMGD